MNYKEVFKKILPMAIVNKIRARLQIHPAEFLLSWRQSMTTNTQPEVYERLVQGVGYCLGMGVEGHIAEFGTMTGNTASILARALNFFSRELSTNENLHNIGKRNLLLFDSFEGLPAMTEDTVDGSSLHVASGLWGKGSCHGISKEELIKLCARFLDKDRIKVYDGWFCDTLPLLDANDKFALIHIDCDLYESTSQVLDFLFGKKMISDGCAIFFDDWNCNRASPKFGERRAWNECVEKYRVNYSDGGDYGICGHKMIIHTE